MDDVWPLGLYLKLFEIEISYIVCMKDHWALPREAPALPPDGLLLNPVIGWQHEVLNAPPIICDMGKKKKKNAAS